VGSTPSIFSFYPLNVKLLWSSIIMRPRAIVSDG
jgi:hypothetical protein